MRLINIPKSPRSIFEAVAEPAHTKEQTILTEGAKILPDGAVKAAVRRGDSQEPRNRRTQVNTHKCKSMKKSVRAYIYDPQSMRRACYTSYEGKSKRQRRKKEVTEVMDEERIRREFNITY